MTQRNAAANRRRTGDRGFTLAEMIVVIIIIGVLATLIVPRVFSRIGQSKSAVAEGNASSLANAMRTAMLDMGGIPEGASVDVLWERPSDVPEEQWHGPYVESAGDLLDPWGNKFMLRVPGEKRVDFDIVSYGRDGKPGGTGEDADIVK